MAVVLHEPDCNLGVLLLSLCSDRIIFDSVVVCSTSVHGSTRQVCAVSYHREAPIAGKCRKGNSLDCSMLGLHLQGRCS